MNQTDVLSDPTRATNSEPKQKPEPKLYPFIRGTGKPFIAKKINRNELCPCGSGKKVKNCHKYETQYYVKKDKRTEEEKYLEQKEKTNGL